MLNLIVAPKEHIYNAEEYAKRVVRYLKAQQVEYSVYFSPSFEDLRASVKKLIALGEHDLVVVGDDVIVHNVLDQIKDLNKIKLGLIPTNKNDDLALSLGLSANPLQAIKDILKNNTQNIDLMVVNGSPVINNLIVGANVEIYHQYSQFKIKNVFTAQYAVKKYGNVYNGIDLHLDNKSKTKKENIFSLVVANGGRAKGKPVSPLANMQDGLFNLTYSLVLQKKANSKFLKKFKKGEHIYDEETKQFWLSSLKITNPEKKIKVLVDGIIQNEEELQISMLEGALKVYKA